MPPITLRIPDHCPPLPPPGRVGVDGAAAVPGFGTRPHTHASAHPTPPARPAPPQKCLVKHKDIRKFLDGIYVSDRSTIVKEA